MITYPRTMPDELRIMGLSFVLKPTGQQSSTRGGKQIWADLGPSLWQAKYDSGNLDEAQFGIDRAWCDTLLNGGEFLGYDWLRQYPVAYKSGWGSLTVGGSPFSGTCLIDDVTSAFEITLKSVPTTGFTLSPGDALAFDYGADPSRALHRVVAGGISAGGEISVEVRPGIRAGWAADATVYLHRPAARMLIIPDSYTEEIQGPRYGRISFEAKQSL